MCVLRLSYFRTGSSCGGAIGWQITCSENPTRQLIDNAWRKKCLCLPTDMAQRRTSVSSFLAFRNLIHWTGADGGVAVVCVGWVGHGSKGQTVVSGSVGSLSTSQDVGDGRIVFLRFSWCRPKGYVTRIHNLTAGSRSFSSIRWNWTFSPHFPAGCQMSRRSCVIAAAHLLCYTARPFLWISVSRTARRGLLLGTHTDWWRFPGSSRSWQRPLWSARKLLTYLHGQ